MMAARHGHLGALAGFTAALVGPALLTMLLNLLPRSGTADWALLYVVLVAALGLLSGLGPAVVAAAASFLLVDYYFAPPFHEFAIANTGDVVNLVVFLAVAGVVGGLGSRRRRAQLEAERLAAQLGQVNVELERLNREQGEAAAVAVRLAQTQQQVRVLEESDRLRTDLLANVSHELRTPLGSILTGATDLLENTALPQRLRPDVESVAREARRLERLVSDLLDMARIEGHALTLNAVDLDLGEALTAAAARLRRASPQRVVTISLPQGDLEVLADWDRLGQILDNLLQNADRHAPVGTPITLEAAAGKRSMVVTRVIDQGPGVAAELRERIFERFVRGPGAEGVGDHGSALGGTGLGLAIVRGLVEAHAGRVWVEDPAPGEGGCFAFTLPAT
jgi:K+-sensing histidine kinase KdpD